MTTFKPGDLAMVRIVAVTNGDDRVAIDAGPRDGFIRIEASALSPLPDPLTAQERAVVEKAMEMHNATTFLSNGNSTVATTYTQAFRAACCDLAAARRPADPMKELREAYGAVVRANYEWQQARGRETGKKYFAARDAHEAAVNRHHAALAAVEAALKAKS